MDESSHVTAAPILLLCSLGLLPPAGAHPSTATQVLYVKPTENTSCPEPCHTLDEYVQNTTRYFVSNTVFKFLPGTHKLSHPLSVSGVTNIAMVGINGTVNITCNNNSLSFTKISDLVEGLTFSFCSGLWFNDLIDMNILHLGVEPDELLLSNIYATNILGKSSFIGLWVVSYYHQIFIEYNDNLGLVLPARNQLDLSQHSPFGYPLGMDMIVNLSQSTYSVDILLEQFTTIQSELFYIILHDESNTSSSVYLSNCNLTFLGLHLHITSAEITVQDSLFEIFTVSIEL